VVAAAGASAAEALPSPWCRRVGASVACSPRNGRRAERPRERIVQRHQERYADLGPTLACEKLAEEGLTVSPDTLVALLRERHTCGNAGVGVGGMDNGGSVGRVSGA
jgi:hypothetical protein